MNQEPSSSGKGMMGSASLMIGVVMLVIGGLIGFGITKAADHNKDKTTTIVTASTNDTKANTLRTDLVTLGVDHMTLTDQAIDAALDGSPDAIGSAVGSVYGTSAQTTVDKVWKLHLDDFVTYATDEKSGNTAGATAALTDINTNYTKPLAAYLAKANPNLSESTLESGLNMHIQMTAQMIQDHVQGNYTAEANELNMANSSIAGLFNDLSNAIIKQYPSKF
jgi:hypothetical protein